MRRLRSRLSAVLFLGLLLPLHPARAQQPPAKGTDVTLPDLPGSTAKVPWSDFAKILEELRKAAGKEKPLPPPPVGYALGRSQLNGEVAADGKSLTLALSLDVIVLEPEKWVDVPLFSGDVAVSQATITGPGSASPAAAPLFQRDGYLVLALKGRGTYALKGTFAVAVGESQGTRSTSFGYWRAAASALELSMPGTDLEITASPGVVAARREEGGKTTATIALPATDRVSLSWHKAIKAETAAAAGGKLHADVLTMVTAGEGVMSAQSVVNLTLYQRKLAEVAVAIPKEMRLLDALGDGISSTRDEEVGAERVVHVTLGFQAEGSYRLTLSYDRSLEGTTAQAALPVVTVKDVDRQTGYIAVAAAGSVEVLTTGALTNLAAVDVSELPPDLGGLAASSTSVLYAFRYVKVPYEAHLDVTRHPDQEVKRAVIEKALVQSFYTKDGKVLTRALYTVRNNQQQYLRVTLPSLPPDAVWGTYLSEKPVKACRQGDGVLLPLEKAAASGAEARSFPVELVFAQDAGKFWPAGSRRAVVPATDLDCLDMQVELYLPDRYEYLAFGGDLTVQGVARYQPPPMYPLPQSGERAKDEEQAVRRQATNVMTQSYMAPATVAPAGAGGEARGILPVKIALPLEGIRIVAGKRVVKSGETPDITFRFYRKTLPKRGSILVLFVALVVGAAFVIALRQGPDQITRMHGIGLLLLLCLLGIVHHYFGRTPAPVVWGLGLPVLLYLVLLARPRKAAAVLLLAALFAAGARAQDVEPTPPALPDTNLAIPWSDMKKLLEQIMKAQQGEKPVPQPPVGYAITRGALTGTVAPDSKSATFTLALDIQVLEGEQWVAVPLGGSDVSFMQATMAGGPAPLIVTPSGVGLAIHGAGGYAFSGSFAVPVSQGTAARTLAFPYPMASVSSLVLTLPEAGMDVTPSAGVVTERRDEGGKTIATIALASQPRVTLSWQRKKDEAATQVEGKVQASVKTLVSVGEGVQSCVSVIDYRIFQKKLTALLVALPKDANVLDVQGAGVTDSADAVEGDARVVRVALPFEAEQNYQLTISYEIPLSASGDGELPVVDVRGVDRQDGHVAVAAKTTVEVSELEAGRKELLPLDPSELPSDLTARSANPVLYGYRYLKVPYAGALHVTRHEDLAVKRSIIDSADIASFTGDDGKVLVKARYQIRNNQKQFLVVTLPEGAEIWSTLVEEKPVKAAKGDKGSLLVPLPKSKVGAENMMPFPVEMVYYMGHPRFHPLGRKHQIAPSTDLECLEMSYTCYVPRKYAVYGFGGSLELQPPVARSAAPSVQRVMLPAPAPPAPTGARDKLRALGYVTSGEKRGTALKAAIPPESPPVYIPPESPPMYIPAEKPTEGTLQSVSPAPTPAAEPQVALMNERLAYNQAAQKAGSARGVLPVKIDIPTEGQAIRFHRKLVAHGEAADLSYWYLSEKLRSPLGSLLFLLAAFFSALAISAVKSASFQPLSRTRALLLVATFVLIVLIRLFAKGSPHTILTGAALPVVLYVLYLCLRRSPERL